MRHWSIATVCVVCSLAAGARAAVIHFDEIPTRPLDGAVVNGVTFGFTIGGAPSTDATFNTLVGPGNTSEIHPPDAEGNAAGIVTITFAQPVDHIEFGFALLSGPLTPGVTVTQFALGHVPAGVTNVNATDVILGVQGHYTYSGVPLESIVLDFNDSAGTPPAFALDDLVFDVASTGASVPLPRGAPAGFALSAAVALSGHRRLRRLRDERLTFGR